MYTFSPMMVANSRKHHCRVRSYTREVLVISTNLDIQKNHYPLDFRNRRGDEARIKNTWYNQGLAPFLNVQMTSVHISSGLVLHQMTSDHNRSELGIQDHNNERSSSKLVPKVAIVVITWGSKPDISNLKLKTNPITVSQPHVIIKKAVNADSNGFSSTGVDITTKTRRPQPRSNTKNDRVPSASKSSHILNKEVEVEDHPRNLLLSKNKKHMSSECNNIKLVIRNDKSKIVCVMCKQCLITKNHDACVLNYVNGMNSRRKKQKANVSNIAEICLKERGSDSIKRALQRKEDKEQRVKSNKISSVLRDE
ncbi:hypothetical protein Tco_0211969 [Tanacetum coccineum]